MTIIIQFVSSMILCSCNIITKSEIQQIIIDLLEEDMWQLLTPGKIYHKLHKRGQCCGCFPNVVDLIMKTTAEFHESKKTPKEKLEPVLMQIKLEHERCETARKLARMQKIRNAS